MMMMFQPASSKESCEKKAKAVSRLDRIKARAIKSVNKELGVDDTLLAKTMGLSSYATKQSQQGSLASALGMMSVDPSTSSPTVRQAPPSEEELVQETAKQTLFQAVAETTSASVSTTSPTKRSKPLRRRSSRKGGERSLGAILSEESERSSVVPRSLRKSSKRGSSRFSLPMSPPLTKKTLEPPSSPAQAGSLAAALGILVNPSAQAPPVRSSQDKSSMPISGKSFSSSRTADTGCLTDSESNNSRVENHLRVAPQAGSLASALSMAVHPSVPATPALRILESPAKKKCLTDAILQNMFLFDDGDDGSWVSDDSSVGYFAAPGVQPQAGSLAAVLGMKVDASSIAPPIRQGGEKSIKNFTPTSNKKKGLMDAVMDSMNTKSRSSSDALRPRPGSLAAALGMGVDSSARAPPVRQKSGKADLENFIGTAFELIGDGGSLSSKVENQRPQAGSLAAALGMAVDPSTQSPTVRHIVPAKKKTNLMDAVIQNVSYASDELSVSSDEESYVDEPNVAGFSPQMGSLAAALGMVVDSSSSAPPVRQVSDMHKALESPPKRRNLMAIVMQTISSFDDASSDSDSDSSVEEIVAASPRAGSLAAALGMAVHPSSAAAPVRQASNRPEMHKKNLIDAVMQNLPYVSDDFSLSSSDESLADEYEHAGFSPQMGSLAAALGMVVDASSTAPPVRQASAKSKTPVAPKKKSFMDLVMQNVASFDTDCSDSDSDSLVEDAVANSPHAGSLAAALGMAVDPSSEAAPIRQARDKPTQTVSVKKKSLFQAILNKMTAADEPVTTATASPQAGSLAAASNMAVDPVVSAPVVRQTTDIPNSKNAAPKKKTLVDAAMSSMTPQSKSHADPPQAGSLAAALSMVVDSSVQAPPTVRQSHAKPTQANSITKKRTLMDVVMSKMASSGDESDSSDEESLEDSLSAADSIPPKAGSLASALGMIVDVSFQAPPIRQLEKLSSISKLDRIKAKAIRSVRRDYGLDMSDVMGVDTKGAKLNNEGSQGWDGRPISKTAQAKTAAQNMGQPQGMNLDYLASALGVPANFFGMGEPQKSLEELECSDSEDEDSVNSQESSEEEAFNPQIGSLAAALGMGVDPSSRAPPARECRKSPESNLTILQTAHTAKTFSSKANMLVAVIQTSDHAKPAELITRGKDAHGKHGSLASALGLEVDESGSIGQAPSVESSSDESSDSGSSSSCVSSSGDSSAATDDTNFLEGLIPSKKAIGSPVGKTMNAAKLPHHVSREPAMVASNSQKPSVKKDDAAELDIGYLANALGVPASFFLGQSKKTKNVGATKVLNAPEETLPAVTFNETNISHPALSAAGELLNLRSEMKGIIAELSQTRAEIGWVTKDLANKSERINHLEANLADERQSNHQLSMRWTEIEAKMQMVYSQVELLRSQLHTEVEDVRVLKATLEKERSLLRQQPLDAAFLSHGGGMQSPVLGNIQQKLKKEGERRKSASAKLKAKARENAILDNKAPIGCPNHGRSSDGQLLGGMISPEGRSLDVLKERLDAIRKRLHDGDI